MKSNHPIVSEDARYKQRQERRDRMIVSLVALTFLAVVIYASLTYRMLKTSQAQIGVMNGANQITAENARADLRAYLNLDDKTGHGIVVTGKETVLLSFYNAGRTPARHLFVAFTVDQKGAPQSASAIPMRHIERFAIVDGSGKGDVIATVGGPDVAGGGMLILPQTKPGADFMKHGWSLNGYFEYCDIFGQWHCDSFFGHSANDPVFPSYSVGSNNVFCDPNGSPYLAKVSKEQGPEAVKRYRPLDRCEQGD
jgi:hypothetical protein